MPADWSLEQVFSEAEKAGFEGVELALGSSGITMDTTEEELTSVKALANKYNITLYSVACSMYFTTPFTSDDPDIRREAKRIARKQLDIAAALGCETVLIVPGVVSCAWMPQIGVTPYDVAYTRALEAMRELALYAEEKNVIIGVENVWNRFLLSPLEMRDFIDKVASDCVGAYFDAGNVLLFGHPEHWVKVLGKRIKKVHIKDFKVQVGNLSGFVPLLEGDLDFRLLMDALREIGYDGWITPEVSSVKTPAEISAAMDEILNIERL